MKLKINNSGNFLRFILIFAIPIIILFFIVLLLTPYWNTNDDVGMSMRAHGYGVSRTASVYLQNSNIMWGYFIKILPTYLGNLPGYSMATLIVLCLFSTSIFVSLSSIEEFFDKNIKIYFVIIVLLLSLIILRPTVFPQFTINAGLLAISAILYLKTYLRNNKNYLLLGFFISTIFGFFIRENQFIITFLIGMTFIPIKIYKINKNFNLCITLIILVLFSGKLFHKISYSKPEWKNYQDLQKARVYWMDYKGFKKLSPDVRKKHGYSKNDISLIGNWFFVDHELHNPDRLNNMRKDMPKRIKQKNLNLDIKKSIKFLLNEKLIPLTISAILLFFLFPTYKLFFAWTLSLSFFIYLGYLGRFGVVRVYIPIISLLVILPFYEAFLKKTFLKHKFLVLFILLSANIYNFQNIRSEHLLINQLSEKFHSKDHSLLNSIDYFVSWGSSFPYVAAYPFFLNKNFNPKIYGLGTSTLNPFSVAWNKEKKNEGFLFHLLSDNGLYLWSWDGGLELLHNYCKEHQQGYFFIIKTNYNYLKKVKCIKKNLFNNY